MKNLVIPFGKYKGKQVEQIAEDKNYCDWLCAQPWFGEKYRDLYQVIINNFSEPEDTPEHNRLQAKFLEETTAFEVARRIACMLGIEIKGEMVGVTFEESGLDVTLRFAAVEGRAHYSQYMVEPTFEDRCRFDDDKNTGFVPFSKWWEKNGKCRWAFSYGETIEVQIGVELKPSIGDDYPTILRKLPKGYYTQYYKWRNLVVLYEAFASEAITAEQAKRFFSTQNVILMSADDAFGDGDLNLSDVD